MGLFSVYDQLGKIDGSTVSINLVIVDFTIIQFHQRIEPRDLNLSEKFV